MKKSLLSCWSRIGIRLFYFLHPIYEKVFKVVLPSTWYELDWLRDHPWKMYKHFDEPHHFNALRRQNLVEAAKQVVSSGIPGDIIEFGVFKGFSAYLMMISKDSHQRYFGVDTFQGLSLPALLDGSHWNSGDLAASVEIVEKKLHKFQDRVFLLKGEIPKVFESPIFDRVVFSFAHIDVDLYEPTKDSLEFVWPKLSSGGVIVCDDYGFSTCPGATLAVDQFLQNNSSAICVIFSTGGIWIRKNEK